MVQAIIYQKDAGLTHGIEQAMGALGQALNFRAQQTQQRSRQAKSGSIIDQAMESLPENPSAIDIQKAYSKAIQRGADPDMVGNTFKTLMPLYSQQLKAAEGQKYLSSIFPEMAQGGNGPQQPQLNPMQPQQASNEINMMAAQPNNQMEMQQSPVQSPMISAQEQPQQPQQLDQSQKFDITKAPIESIIKLSASPYKPHQDLAEAELKRRQLEQKSFRDDRSYHTGMLGKIRERVDTLREAVPKKKSALSLARNAVETGDLGAFSKDRLANAIGGPIGDALRTAKGAQLITAGKENLLGNMSRVSARGQNMWFEQRLNSMFPQIGQSKEANLTVQEMIEGEVSLDDAYLKKFDELWDADVKQYGYPREDIERRARKSIELDEKDIMQRTTYRLKNIEEREKGVSSLKKQVGKEVVKGTPLTLTMAKLYIEKFKNPEVALKAAKKNGYYIPSAEEARRYMMRPNEYMERQ